MKFYIVDAFTDQIFGGNPAGVVILDEGKGFPSDEIMIKTAAELKYSETAFIKPLNKKEFNIRYFTPAAEVDLCGHATIGAFCALKKAGIVKSNETYINHTLAGTLNIVIKENDILMDMGKPEIISKIEAFDKLDEVYKIMGISREGQGNISNIDVKDLLPELVSTGLPDIMLPVKDKETLLAMNPDFKRMSDLSVAYKVVGVHAFTIGEDQKTVYCRNFAPLYDIDEEAATGTANGALTFYLYDKGIIKEGEDNLFMQGESMDRPSKIMSKLIIENNEVKIKVGGRGVVLAEGNINI